VSRRHSSSRRRNYGRRQHEVRERRAGFVVDRVEGEWMSQADTDDWALVELDDDRRSASSRGRDGYDGAQL
jgi:hypothetical protein